MRSKNTLIALIVAVILAVISFVVLSFVGDDLVFVYNLVTYVISAIVAFVLGLMAFIMIRFREKANPVPSKTSHNTAIEVIWTIVPVIILFVMSVYSMNLLYKQDVIKDTELTVKAVGKPIG